jgi:anhydro-N-acetylmuramic acid kinase
MRRPALRALGLMSGTSLDGIDAAVLISDGERVIDSGPALTLPYPAAFRARLRPLLGRRPAPSDARVIAELDDRHIAAVRAVQRLPGVRPLDVIGYHGQTVWHRPPTEDTLGESIQVGDGARLARALGVPVVDQLRAADVAAGGQGAPLVPLYHRALAARLARPIAIVNIGGVANVTWVGDEATAADGGTAVLAFDTGPGNALLDDWLARTLGLAYDAGGRIAAAGSADEALVQQWLAHPFFEAPPPKSLDRDTFTAVLADLAGYAPADGAATLAAFTAHAIGRGLSLLPVPPRRCLVSGGGRHNAQLLALLRDVTGLAVEPVEAVGWRGDALEAEAFAFLAVRSFYGLALSLPSTTGVPRPCPGGRWHRP